MPAGKCCLLLLGTFLFVVDAPSYTQAGGAEDADSQSTSTNQQTDNQSVAESAATRNSAERAASVHAQSTPASLSQGMVSASQQASPSTARALAPFHTSCEDAVSQSAAMSGPNQATREASEPDLASAETLSPESAVAIPARLQSPNQALPGLSAFQMRLHSMLPQLPTMEKLAQLSQEVHFSSCAAFTEELLPLSKLDAWTQ